MVMRYQYVGSARANGSSEIGYYGAVSSDWKGLGEIARAQLVGRKGNYYCYVSDVDKRS